METLRSRPHCISLEQDRREDPLLSPEEGCGGGEAGEVTFHRDARPGMEARIERGAYVLAPAGAGGTHGRTGRPADPPGASGSFESRVSAVLEGVLRMLLEKNRKYGNSALEPARVFSRSSPVEQLLVRIDDKLSRVRNEQGDEDEDVVDDLIGYLTLLKLAREDERRRRC